MKRKKKKWVWISMILLIVGIFLLFTPFLDVVGLATPGTCLETPYNKNCICETRFRKIYIPWLGIDKWSCEKVESLLIDPESPTFEEDSIKFSKLYLEKYCGDVCGVLACADGKLCYEVDETGSAKRVYPTPNHPSCIEAMVGHSGEKRSVNIECQETNEFEEVGLCNTDSEISQCRNKWGVCEDGICYRKTSGYSPWRMMFFVESKTEIPLIKEAFLFVNYCYNMDTGKKCVPIGECLENEEWCFDKLPFEIIPQSNPLIIW